MFRIIKKICKFGNNFVKMYIVMWDKIVIVL